MEKRFTQAQVNLALRRERLILRVEQGESLEMISQDLGVTYHPKHVSRLRRRYIEGGRHWVVLVDGRKGRQAKITNEIVEWIAAELRRDPGVTASYLCDQIGKVFRVQVGERRIQQLVHDIGLKAPSRPPGPASGSVVSSVESPIIEQTQHAGIFFPTGRAVAHGDHGRDAAGV